MKQNMGIVDRIIRVVIAVVFVAIYYLGVVTGPVGIILLVLAATFTLTSVIAFCPLYKPMGLNTKD